MPQCLREIFTTVFVLPPLDQIQILSSISSSRPMARDVSLALFVSWVKGEAHVGFFAKEDSLSGLPALCLHPPPSSVLSV